MVLDRNEDRFISDSPYNIDYGLIISGNERDISNDKYVK